MSAVTRHLDGQSELYGQRSFVRVWHRIGNCAKVRGRLPEWASGRALTDTADKGAGGVC